MCSTSKKARSLTVDNAHAASKNSISGLVECTNSGPVKAESTHPTVEDDEQFHEFGLFDNAGTDCGFVEFFFGKLSIVQGMQRCWLPCNGS